MGFYWNGSYYTIPGAASKVDVSAVSRGSLGAANVVIALGSSTGGAPYTEGTVHEVSSPSEAEDILDDGTLLQGIKKLYAPSPRHPGADVVKIVRVNPATQASYDFGSLKYESRDWGIKENGLMGKIESGTFFRSTELARNLHVRRDDIYETFEDCGPLIKIAYIGTEATCTVAITDDAGDHHLIIDSVDAGEDLDIDLTDPNYNTINELVSFLSSKSWLECSIAPEALAAAPNCGLLDPQVVLPLFSALSIEETSGAIDSLTETQITDADGAFDAADLDCVLRITSGAAAGFCYKIDAQSGTTLDLTDDTLVTDGVGATDTYEVVNYIYAYPYVAKDALDTGSQYVTGVVDTPGTAPTITGWTSLTGGSDGSIATADWQAALNLIKPEEGHLIVVDTTDASFQVLLSTHVRDADLYTRRIGHVGLASSATDADILSRAFLLNNDAMQVAGNHLYDFDSEGEQATYGSSLSAFILCGIGAGQPPEVPQTHKYIGNIIDLNPRPSKTVQRQMINGGVTIIEWTREGFRIVKGVTSVQSNAQDWNPDGSTPEYSLRRIINYIQDDIEGYVDRLFVGGTSKNAEAGLKSALETRCEMYKAANLIYDDLSDINNPKYAYTPDRIYHVGSAWFGTLYMNINGPVNWVFVTLRLRG